MNKLTLAFSPCPNDTFMFDGLVSGRMDTGDLQFEVQLADVEQLNQMARKGLPDITKISFSNYPAISDRYLILDSGSAMGNGCGPLLISLKKFSLNETDHLSIAIPGKFTTANLLLSIFFPEAKKKTEMIFSAIEGEVLNGNYDAGLIIHENRFTYASRGLKKIADMGVCWEEQTGTPVPLGCIVIKRELGGEVHQLVNQLIRESIRLAMENPGRTMPYVKKHAQEMEEHIMKQHIDLYVNKFSLDLGAEGRRAVELLFNKGREHGLLPDVVRPVFMSAATDK